MSDKPLISVPQEFRGEWFLPETPELKVSGTASWSGRGVSLAIDAPLSAASSVIGVKQHLQSSRGAIALTLPALPNPKQGSTS